MADFAKKLAAGMVSVPSRLSWWPRHTRAMSKYLVLSGTELHRSVAPVKEMLVSVATEWEMSIPLAARKGLMGHHSNLEMILVDAAKACDAVKIEKTGALLTENAEEMAASFGRSVIEFPEGRFRKLMCEHVASFVEIVRMKMESSMGEAGARMEKNALSLAAFTAEWF